MIPHLNTIKLKNFKMKSRILIIIPILFFLACGKESNSKKETVKLYVYASTGIYPSNGAPFELTLSGSNIETVKNFNSSYILDVNYPKGETQTLTLTSTRKDVDVQIIVSKDLNPSNSNEIVNKFGAGSLTVSFVAQ